MLEILTGSGLATAAGLNAYIPLLVHLSKASARPGANAVTAGAAAPVLSTAEDTASAALALTAVFLPVLVVVLLVVVLAGLWLLGRWLLRRRRRDRPMGREDRFFAA